ncbi:hypothetical protein H5410_034603 [Solanum commersonii]|uniref:Uncharacterized protein n=1 Tax=Solanum commersonii TaxID=4109 RepID=A0A9J5YRV2_SOLCO|nr:hypothetical protein H5410_034603 [Solanum commersonii]
MQPILNRLTESVFSTLNMYVLVIQYKASIIQLCVCLSLRPYLQL